MGMDVSAHLVFGVKLPESFKRDTDEFYYAEELENIFYSSEGKPYPHLDLIHLGSCEEPDIIISCLDYSVDWTSIPIDLDEMEPRHFDELAKFCKDFDIEFKAEWYLGCYVSY